MLVACGVRFFFHFQSMLTINHSAVQIADATASANALDTPRLAWQKVALERLVSQRARGKGATVSSRSFTRSASGVGLK